MSPLDDNADIHARISVLEDWREEYRAWMAEMRALVQTLSNSVMSLRLCSTPNACAGLSKEIEKLAKEHNDALGRLESLERWRTFQSGVIATVGILWLVFQVILPWIVKLAGVDVGA